MSITTPTMQDLLGAGVHFGHKVSRAHPKMKGYIYGARDGVSILDLAKSEEKLNEATKAAYELGKNGKVLLLVGTKKQAREIVEELAHEVDTPFLTYRWIGGVLTNFDEIKKNIRKLVELKDLDKKGQLAHYTKKERLLITRKLEKFERDMGGVAAIDVVPDAIFIVDPVSDQTAVKEATRMGLKILGFSDTNADPNWFDYPIPANDDGIKSIKIVCETVIRAYGQGKKEAGNLREKELEKQKEAEKKAEAIAAGEVLPKETVVLEEVIEKEILSEQERKV